MTPPADVPRWAEAYVGLPFAANGRGRAGLDCWGLVQLVLAERAGLAVPGYGETDAADLAAVARRVAEDRAGWPWVAVLAGHGRALDVVVMTATVRDGTRPRRAPCHCGILVAPGRLLHVEAATASVVVPLSHASVAARIVSIHRHAALA